MTFSHCRVALACLAVTAVSSSAGAQTAGIASTTVPTQGGGAGKSVIVPPGGIDPGMRIRTPRIPARSTPIIRPPHQAADGKTLVVPR